MIFKEYILRILCCTLLCCLVLSFFPEGKIRNLIRTCSGILLTISILSPVPDLKLPSLDIFGENYIQQSQMAVEAGESYARQQRYAFIKDNLETYILDKARQLGCDLSAAVEIDEDGYPDAVILWGDVTPDVRKTMEKILWEELGIAKEDQQWNGSQTKQQSIIP